MNENKKNISISHGSGGKLTHELIQEVFYKHFANPLLAIAGDAAVFANSGDYLAMTTDSYVVNPLFFPGGNVGELAVSGTVNDLAVSGAKPLYLSAGFIIEEGFSIEELDRIVESMADTAKKAGIQIIAGDTKVVEKGQCDKVFINTTGVGVVRKEHCHISSGTRIKAGDKIIISGKIADHGIAVLCARNDLGISADIKSDVAPLNGLIELALYGCSGISFMRDPTRGGLATTLVEIAKKTRLGIEVNEEAVPVNEEVLGVCELLGFDPLYIANEGKVIFVVDSDNAEKLIAVINAHPLGKEAIIIGSVTEAHAAQVVLKTTIGGKRILDMLSGEQIPRIC